jgi:hypothetical protein
MDPVSLIQFVNFRDLLAHGSSFQFTHLSKSSLTINCWDDTAERKASQEACSRQGEKRVFSKHRPCILNTKPGSGSILLQKTRRTKMDPPALQPQLPRKRNAQPPVDPPPNPVPDGIKAPMDDVRKQVDGILRVPLRHRLDSFRYLAGKLRTFDMRPMNIDHIEEEMQRDEQVNQAFIALESALDRGEKVPIAETDPYLDHRSDGDWKLFFFRSIHQVLTQRDRQHRFQALGR